MILMYIIFVLKNFLGLCSKIMIKHQFIENYLQKNLDFKNNQKQ